MCHISFFFWGRRPLLHPLPYGKALTLMANRSQHLLIKARVPWKFTMQVGKVPQDSWAPTDHWMNLGIGWTSTAVMYGSSSKDSSAPATCPAWCHTPRRGRQLYCLSPGPTWLPGLLRAGAVCAPPPSLSPRLWWASLGHHVCLSQYHFHNNHCLSRGYCLILGLSFPINTKREASTLFCLRLCYVEPV